MAQSEEAPAVLVWISRLDKPIFPSFLGLWAGARLVWSDKTLTCSSASHRSYVGQACTKISPKIKVECVPHPAKRVADAALYPLSFVVGFGKSE